MRNILTDKAGELAEKYEDAAEKQQKVTDRLVQAYDQTYDVY